jgi:beta-lactamase regulating signal transducer with metallopeptidase domain
MHLLFINAPFLQALTTALCWTLVHSLWQGLIAAIAASLVLLLTRRSRPVVRYNLLTGLFVLFALAAAFTFFREWRGPHQVSGAVAAGSLSQPSGSGAQFRTPPPPTGSAISSRPATDAAQLLTLLTDLLSRNAVLIVAIWCFVLGIRIFRISCTLLYTRHIKRHRSRRPSAELVDRFASLCIRLRIQKPVTLLETEIIKMPAVFGHLKPVIFIPFGLLTQLPPSQVEAILIHELAHIRRNDFLVNLLQSIVETLFFFNPAATWLSSLIRETREHCCDDIALEQTHDKQQFIRALISCMTRMTGDQPNWTISFLGRRNAFVNRAERLVQNRNKALNRAEGFFLGLSLLTVGLMTVAFTESRRTEPGIAKAATDAATRRMFKKDMAEISPLKMETANPAPSKPQPAGAVKPPRKPINDTLPPSNRDTTWGPYPELRMNDRGDIVAEIVIHGVNYRLTRTDGAITELSVDHQEIPQSDIPKYSAITNAICADAEAHFNRPKDQKKRFDDQDLEALRREVILRQIDVDRAQENFALRQLDETGASHPNTDARRAKLAEIRTQMNNLAQEAAQLEQSIAKDDQQRQNGKFRQDLQQNQLDFKAILSAQQDLQQRQQDLQQRQQDLQQQRIDLRQRLDEDMKKEKTVKAIMIELVDEHLVKDRESLKTFSLNNDEMIINGVQQPAEVHQRFKAKYLKTPTDQYNLVND